MDRIPVELVREVPMPEKMPRTAAVPHDQPRRVTAPAPDRLRVGADELTIRVTSAETGGALMAADVHMPAGGGPPVLHRHAPAEVYRVTAGVLTIYLEDDRGEVERIVTPAGAVVHIPGGREHTIRNESDSAAEANVTFVPGEALEHFARAAAASAADGPPRIEDVLALAERHGIEMTRPVPAAS
jgi:oxalate decarboxylase/phosphoglucose isomerase-like protein (cupin superfamily)